MKIFKILLLLPTILVLSIYFTVVKIKLEYFNEDIVEYELSKYTNGEDHQIKEQMEFVIKNNKNVLTIFSILFWLLVIYNKIS